jgi:CxxC-x17-CxxC domain-containing protein
VEQEINDWSGMSLGDDNSGGGSFEKFDITCSLCGQEKTVPFKPESGRAVYCKECMSKIKSGEVKIERKGENQIKYDDSRFFKPLSDLGIEFPSKDSSEDRNITKDEASITASSKPWKNKATKKSKPNTKLKEIINKITTNSDVSPEEVKPVVPPPIPPAISLESLKEKTKEMATPSRDRSASAEDMNKLKDLITASGVTPQKTVVSEKITSPDASVPSTSNLGVKEVPEDILRKILEE